MPPSQAWLVSKVLSPNTITDCNGLRTDDIKSGKLCLGFEFEWDWAVDISPYDVGAIPRCVESDFSEPGIYVRLQYGHRATALDQCANANKHSRVGDI